MKKIRMDHLRLVKTHPGYIIPGVLEKIREHHWLSPDYHHPSGWSLYPSTISLTLTYRCNLKCFMCWQYKDNIDGVDCFSEVYDPQEELSAEEVGRFVDEVKHFRPVFFLTGGEPLLHREIVKVLEHIKSAGLYVTINTNGVLLEKFAEAIVDLGVDHIIVSIDGNRETHDRIRGVPGTYDRAIEGIRRIQTLRKKRGTMTPQIRANCTISEKNQDALLEMVALCEREIQPDILNFCHLIFYSEETIDKHNRNFPRAFAGDPVTPGFPESAPKGEYYIPKTNGLDVQAIADDTRRIMKLKKPFPIAFVPPLAPDQVEPYYANPDRAFEDRCMNPWKRIEVRPNGAVESCLHYYIGDIRSQTFREIWNGEKMKQFRKTLKAGGLFPACQRCCFRCY